MIYINNYSLLFSIVIIVPLESDLIFNFKENLSQISLIIVQPLDLVDISLKPIPLS